MKNCNEYVHFEVVEQHILQEMVKIVQKKVYSNLPFPAPLLTIIMLPKFKLPGEVKTYLKLSSKFI